MNRLTNENLYLIGEYLYRTIYRCTSDRQIIKTASDNMFYLASALEDKYRMRLFLKQGAKVTFSTPDTKGSNIGSNSANENLECTSVYTVDYTQIGGWNAYYILKEKPGMKFKVKCFNPVDELESITIEELVKLYNGDIFTDLKNAEEWYERRFG